MIYNSTMMALIIVDLQKEYFGGDSFDFKSYALKYEEFIYHCMENNISVMWFRTEILDKTSDEFSYIDDVGHLLRFGLHFEDYDLLESYLINNDIDTILFAGLDIKTTIYCLLRYMDGVGFNVLVLEDLLITNKQYIYTNSEVRIFEDLKYINIGLSNNEEFTSSNEIMNKWGGGSKSDSEIVDINILNMISFPFNIIKHIELNSNITRLNLISYNSTYKIGKPMIILLIGDNKDVILTNKLNTNIRQKIPLRSGKVVILGFETNRLWDHEIKHKSDNSESMRMIIQKIDL